VISLQQQSTNFQQGTPQLLQYQQATDFGPMEVLQQPTIQALNQLPTVNTVVQQPIPQHIQSEENKSKNRKLNFIISSIANFYKGMLLILLQKQCLYFRLQTNSVLVNMVLMVNEYLVLLF